MATTSIDEFGLVRSEQEEVEESYFVSMTDIMVGLLFVFIIMLMAFGLMLKIAAENTEQTRVNIREVVSQAKAEIDDIRDVDSLRTQMLRGIENRLRAEGVQVIVREENGVLQLPDEILFGKNKDTLSEEGIAAIGHLARALDAVLPCYAITPRALGVTACENRISDGLRLEAVFVEGHTDKDGSQEYNWALSANRAINTFRALDSLSSISTRLRNDQEQSLFSISGYGENRPVEVGDSENEKSQNRRIDLRFVMNVSHEEALERVQRRLGDALEAP